MILVSQDIFILFRLESKLIGNHKFKAKLKLSDNKIISSESINLFLYNSKSMRNGSVNWGEEDSYFKGSNLSVVGVDKNDTLNVRDVYGINGKIIGKIPNDGKGIEFLNLSAMENKSKWIYINYNGLYGWVNSRYIKNRENISP